MTTKPLAFYTLNSFMLHLVVVAMIFFSTLFLWQGQKALRKENLKLVEASVRVDMVALPDKTLKELKSLQQLQRSAPQKVVVEEVREVVKKEVPKEDTFVKKEKTKVPKKSLSDLLKKYSDKKVKKVKKVKKKAPREKGLSKSAMNKLSELVKKGNIVKSGAALAGSGSQEELDALESYSAGLPEVVRAHWQLPSYLLESELRCRVRIFLKKDGSLLRKTIFESSGDEEYDRRALKAIDAVGIFPPVPETIIGRVAQGDIVLAFPL